MISVLLFGFLWWSSSWWWWPHIAGCKMFGALLRAGLTVLAQFFCKMYFLWVLWSRKKNLVQFFLVLPPQMAFFFQAGVPGQPDCQNWGHCPQSWQSKVWRNYIRLWWRYQADHFAGIEGSALISGKLQNMEVFSWWPSFLIDIVTQWTLPEWWFSEYLMFQLSI